MDELIPLERLGCSQCGTPLAAPAPGEVVLCDRCGAQNHLAYLFERDELRLVRHKVDLLQLRRELERRIEILTSNLDAIDPLSRWPAGGPRFTPRHWGPPLAGLAVGLLLLLRTPLGGLLAGVAALLFLSRAATAGRLAQWYQRDRAVTARNGPLVERLQRELHHYRDLSAQIAHRSEP